MDTSGAIILPSSTSFNMGKGERKVPGSRYLMTGLNILAEGCEQGEQAPREFLLHILSRVEAAEGKVLAPARSFHASPPTPVAHAARHRHRPASGQLDLDLKEDGYG